MLSQEDFDLLFMDIQLPGMNGVEAARVIRGSPGLGPKGQIPIIAMTAYAMSGDRENFLEAGLDDYIAKPVDFEELKAVIDRVMAKVKG
jgi:CheY-like chemotaxis protein